MSIAIILSTPNPKFWQSQNEVVCEFQMVLQNIFHLYLPGTFEKVFYSIVQWKFTNIVSFLPMTQTSYRNIYVQSIQFSDEVNTFEIS
jgi:hypothetical protein